MRRIFKLHHHKHTGKLIHHRHTSYWALCLIVIVSGLFAVAIERAASADDLLLSATVPAPIPAGAPTITTPANGATLTASPIAFSGDCPVITPAVIIQFIEDVDVLGSTPCRANGTFSITLAVSPGQHSITAQVITITGQTGQSSSPVTITYSPATPPAPVTPEQATSRPTIAATKLTPSTLQAPIAAPGTDGLSLLSIQLSQSFISYRPGTSTSIHAVFSGGTPPYIVRFSWGDGATTTEKISDNIEHEFSHTYGQSGSYLLAINLTDARNEVLTRNYAVVDARPVGLHITSYGAASLIDGISGLIVRYPLIVYSGLLGVLILLWSIEFLRYPNRVAIPIHYRWQHPKTSRKR